MHNLPTSENHKPPGPCSTPATSLSDRLTPATAKAGTAELLACLTLVAPSGMTAEDRNAWAQVARQTLKGIPADLLELGCGEARKRCRFPSEIVPVIFETVEGYWKHRRRMDAEDRARRENMNAPRLAKPEYVEASELAKLAAMLLKGR